MAISTHRWIRIDYDSKYFRITFADLIRYIRGDKSLADGVCRRTYATPAKKLETTGNPFVLIIFAGVKETTYVERKKRKKKGYKAPYLREMRKFKLLIVNAGKEDNDTISSWRDKLRKAIPAGRRTIEVVDVLYEPIQAVPTSDAYQWGYFNLVLYFYALVNLNYIHDENNKPMIENPRGWIKLIQKVGTLLQYPLDEFTSGGSLFVAMHHNKGFARPQDLDSAWTSLGTIAS